MTGLGPAVLALLGVSLVVSGLLAGATAFALHLLYHWNIHSGSERQLRLERRTYLISTIVGFAALAELIALLLFVYNAEAMSGQFVGAMCATGVLNINPWGWPTLLLKIAVFFVAGIWLNLNRLDNQARDYPLIRPKYLLLLLLTPLVWAEGMAQALHLLQLDPDVITSCCGALFTPTGKGVAAEVAGLAPRSAALGLYLSGVAVVLSALWYRRSGHAAGLTAVGGVAAFALTLVAVVSYLALYVYEHPHHHCPFCLLKAGHDHIGYWLYIPLFGATLAALNTGVLAHWQHHPSLPMAAALARRQALIAAAGFGFVLGLSIWLVASSGLHMQDIWW